MSSFAIKVRPGTTSIYRRGPRGGESHTHLPVKAGKSAKAYNNRLEKELAKAADGRLTQTEVVQLRELLVKLMVDG